MAKIFDDILSKGIRQGQVPARTGAAREWYRTQAKAIAKAGGGRGVSGASMTSGSNIKGRTTASPEIGGMYSFQYDAKHKDKLPYYDMYPLIFPINTAKGGFLGINMHYLPPALRAQLMDALYSTVTNENYDEKTKLKLSYDVLNGASKFRAFKPTIKHYLTKQMRTPFIYVNPTEWDIALFLPTAKFVGANKQKVYADSRKIIRG